MMLKLSRLMVLVAAGSLILPFTSGARQQNPQPQPPAAQPAGTITNDDVIRLVHAKLGDELIIAKIRSSATAFDTSIDTIVKLKSLGISDAVIQVMITAKNSSSVTQQQNLQTQPQSSDPMRNENVIKLVNAGIGDPAIAVNIQQACLRGACKFDLSPDATLSLRHAGVSDYLIQMMTGMSTYSNLVTGQHAWVDPRQSDPNALPTDSWRGLVLDQATVEDAVAKLGTPTEDLIGQRIEYINLGFRFTPEADHANLRTLVYKPDKKAARSPDLEGIKAAKLYFLNNKLVEIHVEPGEKIDPNTLGKRYGGFFEASPEYSQFVSHDASHYFLTLESTRSYICARIEQGSTLRILPEIVNTNSGYLRGWVHNMDLISKAILSNAANKALQ